MGVPERRITAQMDVPASPVNPEAAARLRTDVVKSALLRADADTLFAALASPAGIRETFDYLIVEMQCQAGGALALHGLSKGLPFIEVGTVDIYDAPRTLQLRYARGRPGVTTLPNAERVLRIDVEPLDGGRCRLAIVHAGLASADERSAADEYWERLLDSLPSMLDRENAR